MNVVISNFLLNVSNISCTQLYRLYKASTVCLQAGLPEDDTMKYVDTPTLAVETKSQVFTYGLDNLHT